MPHSPENLDFIRNIYDAQWIPLLPAIRGKSGVAGFPAGMDIDEPMGIDLIDMDAHSAFPLHTHPGSHILFILEGKGTVTIGDNVYETKPGDCYFVPADVAHGVGAIEHHQLLSIGFPHKKLDDPARMNIVDSEYLEQQPMFATIYSNEGGEEHRIALAAFQKGTVAPQEELATLIQTIRTALIEYLVLFTNNDSLRKVADTMTLQECGISSLTLLQFVGGLEEAFAVTVDDRSFNSDNFKTLGSVLKLLCFLLRSR